MKSERCREIYIEGKKNACVELIQRNSFSRKISKEMQKNKIPVAY